MTHSSRRHADNTAETLAAISRIINDPLYSVDPLLPELKSLLNLYGELEKKLAAITKDRHQLQVQLGEMNKSLELATRIDPMTGLANRRDIVERIEREYNRAHRHVRTFSVMLADIDDFKKVNETYGINDGDDVLVEVARVLRGSIRNEDVCARWGGEEFLILLPETGIEGAAAVASKILESVSMTEFKANRPGIRITVSIGLCEYNIGQTVFECIGRANEALQLAKLSGKNRSIVAG